VSNVKYKVNILSLIPIIFLLILTSDSLAKNMTIKWEEVSNASYYNVQIAEDKNFFHIIYEFEKITQPFITVDLKEDTYYCRISGVGQYEIPGPYSRLLKLKVTDKVEVEEINNKNNKLDVAKSINNINREININKRINMGENDSQSSGNKSTTRLHFMIDDTPQTKNYIIVPVNKEYSFNSSSPDIAKIFYSINDQNFQEFNKEKKLNFSKDGYYNLFYYAVDNVGNKSKIITTFIAVDGTAPTVDLVFTLYFYKEGIYYISPKSDFTFSASDNNSGVDKVYYSLNEGKFKEFDNTRFDFDKDKINSIKYYAVDRVGNQSNPVEKKIFIDSNPPVIEYKIIGNSIPQKDGSFIVGGKATLEVTATDNLLDSIYISINKGTPFLYTEPVVFKDNESDIVIEAFDRLRNSSKKSLKVIKDTTPPENRLEFYKK